MPEAQKPPTQTIKAKGLIVPTAKSHQGRNYICPVCHGKGKLKYLEPAKGPNAPARWVWQGCFGCNGKGRLWV